ncbi:DAHL domain-containing protein [Burkholderia ubonensis]|uniref:DAHL domain-containing protein n=1 Tax=Burkholderia ubonensis TaxID=101571 RepID=UPI001E58FACD|nr:DAHL domain-containing protein [Burkholderia ubonensis]
MMALPKRQAWFPMAALGTLLVSALLFLYDRTRDYDPASYFENVSVLRQAKQLDARWELDAMKSKVGINNNYDPLVDPLNDLSALRQRMADIIAAQGGDDKRALSSADAAYRRALDKKARLIENFKSHNSVLRNSLLFLPTAAADVRELAGQGAGGDPAARARVQAEVDRALLDTLVYVQAATADKAAEIDAELARLVAASKGLPADFANRVGIFVAHARTIVREHAEVNGLLGDIAAAPTAARIDDFNNILNDTRQRASVHAQEDQLYLLFFAAALIALLVYAAGRIIRSHAVINRVNAELKQANDRLEERVQQRTRELQEAQAELMTIARKAGMAEIATNVLHNVGNVLNSVNVSAGVLGAQVRASRSQGLSKAVGLLDAHRDDLGEFLTRDPGGRMLPDYLRKLAQTVSTERQGMLDEIANLTKSIDHIKDIVATQQRHAGASMLFETVQVGDLIDDALRICGDSLARHRVRVVKEFEDVPAPSLDKHRVLQILVNLISNAKHAMDGVPDRAHLITVRLQAAPDDKVRIQVADNGEGIRAENLKRVFEHGFTTRANGHGFGLHSSILAAQEMGASLTAHSDGPGKGAVFTLDLPVNAGKETKVDPTADAKEAI